MAGALTISTLNDSSGVLATQNGMTGVAKAWVNFNQGTSAIRGSFNVSSVTLNSTGVSTINFTTAMPNANYTFSGSCGYGTGGPQSNYVALPTSTATSTAMTTSSLRVQNYYGNAQTNSSIEYFGVTVFSS